MHLPYYSVACTGGRRTQRGSRPEDGRRGTTEREGARGRTDGQKCEVPSKINCLKYLSVRRLLIPSKIRCVTLQEFLPPVLSLSCTVPSCTRSKTSLLQRTTTFNNTLKILLLEQYRQDDEDCFRPPCPLCVGLGLRSLSIRCVLYFQNFSC